MPGLIATMRIELTLANGELLFRELLFGDPLPPWLGDPHPSWLYAIDRAWPTPQSPVTLRGQVYMGHEDEARAWLFWDSEDLTDEQLQKRRESGHSDG